MGTAICNQQCSLCKHKRPRNQSAGLVIVSGVSQSIDGSIIIAETTMRDERTEWGGGTGGEEEDYAVA